VRYIDEFRDGDLARGLGSAIAQEAAGGRAYHLMEF
jgi:hydrogenase expression/formation protein HypD